MSELGKLQSFVQNSEWTLINFMHETGNWKGTLPNPPEGYNPDESSIEMGLAAYWLNNVDVLKFPSSIKNKIYYAVEIWKHILGDFPEVQMTDENYSFVNSIHNHMVYTDGSVLNSNKFATYDQNWFLALLNLIATFFHDLWKYDVSDYPATTEPIRIESKSGSDTVKIAIVGDWGTGDAAAESVMNHIKVQNPDYIIHLGDVYYSGTPDVGSHYFNLGEEQHHLLDLWPNEYAVRSFTLNSNHEMYTGANGYFDIALGKVDSPFSAQRGEGCFALQYGDWTLLGLDSGYFGTSRDLFMKGNIGEEGTPQREWIKGLNLDASKTIVLTHHTGFTDDCSAVNPLWTQVHQALGNQDPFAWYWGHVHNGIVYKSPLQIKEKGQPTFTSNTFTRCSGHGALPYGNATDLDKIEQIAWRETQEIPISHQLHNGFAMIELTKSGDMISVIDESYFNTGQTESVYNFNLFNATIEETPKKKTTSSTKKRSTKKKTTAPKKAEIKKPSANSNFGKALKANNVEFNPDLYEAILRYLGPAATHKDASLVACSDPVEVKTVKNNFLIKKLGQKSSPKLNKVIREVCEALGASNRKKKRVDFYYLLTVMFQKEDVFI